MININKKVLIVVAMEEESYPIIRYLGLKKGSKGVYSGSSCNCDVSLVVTGVGMVNVAMRMTDIGYSHYDIIINIGYAGSKTIEVGEWVSVTNVYEFDFDISNVGIDMRMDPSKISNYQNIKSSEEMIKASCYTGSSFIDGDMLIVDSNKYVVDMEAYMVVAMASIFNQVVKVYKLVSDKIDGKEFNESMTNLLIDDKIGTLFEEHNILL